MFMNKVGSKSDVLPATNKVILRSSDGVILNIKRTIASKSTTLEGIIEDSEPNEVIPVPFRKETIEAVLESLRSN